MTKKVFCGGLPYGWSDQDLTEALSQFGPISDAKVIIDRETGNSRGFGFVTFLNTEDAAQAVQTGSIRGGNRTVHINEAREQERRERRNDREDQGPPRRSKNHDQGRRGRS